MRAEPKGAVVGGTQKHWREASCHPDGGSGWPYGGGGVRKKGEVRRLDNLPTSSATQPHQSGINCFTHLHGNWLPKAAWVEGPAPQVPVIFSLWPCQDPPTKIRPPWTLLPPATGNQTRPALSSQNAERETQLYSHFTDEETEAPMMWNVLPKAPQPQGCGDPTMV